MKIKTSILNIFLTIAITFGSFFAIQNYVPFKYLETKQEKKLGTSLTTIQATDKISLSRTTINDNFTALNNGKIESSTTTLPLITTLANLATVGTITSGTWSGTAILTAKGGTGSTTLASNQLLLGNGTGNIGIVSGLGTSGQFLTSNGAGLAPTWQTSAVDQAVNYNWTGLHNFTGNTFLKNLNASSTLTLNGISLSFPSTQGASSTVLMNNGSGSMTWNSPDWELIGETILTSANSTTTVSSLPARKDLKVVVQTNLSALGTGDLVMRFNQDSSNSYGYIIFGNYQNVIPGQGNGASSLLLLQPATTSLAYLNFNIENNASTRKFITFQGSVNDTGADIPVYKSGAAVWNNNAQITRIDLLILPTNGGANQLGNGTRLSVYGSKN